MAARDRAGGGGSGRGSAFPGRGDGGGRGAGGGGSAGFTLVELLVALAVVGLMVAVVPSSLSKLREGADYRDTVRTVLGELRGARQRALLEGRDVRFVVDLAGRRYGIDGAPGHALPEPLTLRVTVAGVETAGDRAAIRFLPQGGATGGTVDVLRPRGDGARLTVDWLSAAVSQAALAP